MNTIRQKYPYKSKKIFNFFYISLFFLVLFSISYFPFFEKSYLKDHQILLAITLILIIFLISFFSYKVVKQLNFIFFQTKFKIAGHQLHQKLALLFSAVCLMPAFIISAFSILTLNSALEEWFNKKISTAVTQSVEVANQYLVEHKKAMKGKVLDLANQLDRNSVRFSSNEKKINDFLDNYVVKNNFADAILLDSTRNILAKSRFSFEINYFDMPENFFNVADKGNIVLINDEDTNKVRAFIKLNQFVDAYLLVSRFLDKEVLNAIKNTTEAALDYQNIELKKLDIKISFLVMFLLISFLLLLISLYVGLGLANRLISPISELIFAAEEVGRGNLDFQIKNKSLLKNKVSELKHLGNAFNKMILDIKNNRSELVEANAQIDKRRKFSEAVLSGVYSGVIGLDEKMRINLLNKKANEFFNISIEKFFEKNLVKIIPEFKTLFKQIKIKNKNFIEDKIELLRNEKNYILIARIVKQTDNNMVIGYVVTFEDVTNLINAQKMAAWSDIARKIAHEIKNPLTPLKLGAERLKGKNLLLSNNRKKFNQTLEMILRQVDDIHHLVDEFSSFARMPSPKLKKINLSVFMHTYLEPISNFYPNIEFKNEFSKNANVFSLIDEKQIRQVLTNVIKNSYECFEISNFLNPIITISFVIDKSFCIIRIKDNGNGFQNVNKEKVMEPYYTTKANGTGLGLSICKKIMEDHNGSIDIESSKNGTSVILMLPKIN